MTHSLAGWGATHLVCPTTYSSRLGLAVIGLKDLCTTPFLNRVGTGRLRSWGGKGKLPICNKAH